MRDLTFTLYDSEKSTTGSVRTMPWAGWIKVFSAHDMRPRKSGPAVILGAVKDARSNANVLWIDAVSIDLDGVDAETARQTLETLQPYTYAAWTTYSQGAGPLYLRIVLPVAAPHTPDQHAKRWQALQRLIGGRNDPKTKDCARLNYLPACSDRTYAHAWQNTGKLLDLDEIPTENDLAIDSAERSMKIERARRKIRALPLNDALSETLHGIAHGKPFAEPGDRHNALVQATWWLATRCPELTEPDVEALFLPSVRAMSTQENPPNLQEIAIAFAGAVDKRRDEASRRQADDSIPYSEPQLDLLAEKLGLQSRNDLRKRWIIGREGRFWILHSSGEYWGSYSEKDATIVARSLLRCAPVQVIRLTDRGESFVPFLDLASRHSSIARKTIADMSAEHTYYDAESRTIYEATSPLRIRGPGVFDEAIDRWLQELGGPHYDKLQDWLACLPHLDRLLCAIYFDGDPGAGKTVFAHGLAKLWTDGAPGDLGLAISNFNSEIIRCPLLFADEALPTGRDVTTTLRAMISTSSRSLNRKFHEASDLKGAIRVILAANNESLLTSEGAHTSADLQAIAQRFLHVPIRQACVEHINTMPFEVKKHWLDEGLAQHALYLSHNRQVLPKTRFWVEGELGDMHLLLLGSSKWNAFVLEWCTGYLMAPQVVEGSRGSDFVQRIGGRLYVNVEAVTTYWGTYITADKTQPSTNLISRALRAIASPQGTVRLPGSTGSRLRYHDINLDVVFAWAERSGKGDRETMEKNLGPTTDEERQQTAWIS